MIYVAKKLQTVRAWKYVKDADVPIWVARKCHDLGDGKLTANTPSGPLAVDVGDYVVLIDEETSSVVVVNGAAFEEEYEPQTVANG